jgi:hypothetical protein
MMHFLCSETIHILFYLLNETNDAKMFASVLFRLPSLPNKTFWHCSVRRKRATFTNICTNLDVLMSWGDFIAE